MPQYLRGQERDVLSFVRLRTNALLFYGWKAKDMSLLTGVTEGDLIALGHTTAGNLVNIPGAFGIIGANSPKPARATKRLIKNPTSQQQGSASTFVAGTSISTAVEAGWNVARGRSVRFSQTARFTTLAASLSGGGYYCFPVNTDEVAVFTAELGLITPDLMSTAERAMAFTATSNPRPPEVSKTNPDGSTTSTFCSHDAVDSAADAGWNIDREEMPYVQGLVAP
jgi:hypothetical protein